MANTHTHTLTDTHTDTQADKHTEADTHTYGQIHTGRHTRTQTLLCAHSVHTSFQHLPWLHVLLTSAPHSLKNILWP